MKLSGEIHLEKNSLGQLQEYPWPGNVRQFRNLVERALTLDAHGPLDLVQYLPKSKEESKIAAEMPTNFKEMIQNEIKEMLAKSGIETNNIQAEISSGNEVEGLLPIDSFLSAHISRVLKHCGGKISGPKGAAEILEIHPSTLRKRMKKLGIPFGLVR